MTPSTISQVESGQIYPSIPALLKISELLSVDIASFFGGEESESDRIFYPESEGVEIAIPGVSGNGTTVKEIIPPNRDAGFEPYLVEFEPGAALKSHFFHHKGDEFGFLVAGTLMMYCGNDSVKEVEAGTLINLSQDMASGWSNASGDVARLLWIKVKK